MSLFNLGCLCVFVGSLAYPWSHRAIPTNTTLAVKWLFCLLSKLHFACLRYQSHLIQLICSLVVSRPEMSMLDKGDMQNMAALSVTEMCKMCTCNLQLLTEGHDWNPTVRHWFVITQIHFSPCLLVSHIRHVCSCLTLLCVFVVLIESPSTAQCVVGNISR